MNVVEDKIMGNKVNKKKGKRNVEGPERDGDWQLSGRSGVRFLGRDRDFSLCHLVQTARAPHPATCPRCPRLSKRVKGPGN
jgi:hypothetical protein